MFDDIPVPEAKTDANIPPLRTAPPASLPSDMFADTEVATADLNAGRERPAVFAPKPVADPARIPAPVNLPADAYVDDAPTGGYAQKAIVGIVALAVVGGLGFGGYYAYGRFSATREAAEPPAAGDTPAPATPAPAAPTAPSPSPAAPAPVTPKPADTDQDGLSDDEERILGTNPGGRDSDGDGLFDREEVRVYETNPNEPDTDGDGFLDGLEVDRGFNPKGSGKLYEVK